MNNFWEILQEHIGALENILNKAENGAGIVSEIRSYLPSMNHVVTAMIELSTEPNKSIELNHEFVIQVLNDIVYGIQNEDEVYLQDVLQYGLLEIYNYVSDELRNEEVYG